MNKILSKTPQIPMMSVVMKNGEMVMFSLQATDAAGNTGTLVSPPLTIDTMPPILTGFTCNYYTSKARSQV